MTRQSIFAIVWLAATLAVAETLPFTTTHSDAWSRCVDHYDRNVSTNHPSDPMEYPFAVWQPVGEDLHIDWSTTSPPTEAEFNAADGARGTAVFRDAQNDALHGAGSSDVRDASASNIVALSSAYGVTDQPISWAAIATAMQIERTDATASNDVMRLLTGIGDGTTLLSFKEFYSENGGDVFNVRWP